MELDTLSLSAPIEIWDESKKNDLIFLNADDKWIMKIKGHGKIEFNHEEFPDLAADDFAKEVISLLEKLFCRLDGK